MREGPRLRPPWSEQAQMSGRLLNKVLGCVIGATIGDSIGAVVEFRDREAAKPTLDGREWVDGMHPFKDIAPNPLGVFRADPPSGTGTDDTRLNQLFLECVARNNGRVDSRLLAAEYIERHRAAETYCPLTPEVAREQRGLWLRHGTERAGFLQCRPPGLKMRQANGE